MLDISNLNITNECFYYFIAFTILLNQGEQIVRDIKRLDRNYEAYLQEDEIRINRLVIQEKLRQFEKV